MELYFVMEKLWKVEGEVLFPWLDCLSLETRAILDIHTSQTANGYQVPKDLTLVTEFFRSCLSQTNLKGVEPGESGRQAGDGAVGQQPVVDFVLQPEQREVVHEGERVEVGMDPNVGDLNFGSLQLAKDKKGSYWSRTWFNSLEIASLYWSCQSNRTP